MSPFEEGTHSNCPFAAAASTSPAAGKSMASIAGARTARSASFAGVTLASASWFTPMPPGCRLMVAVGPFGAEIRSAPSVFCTPRMPVPSGAGAEKVMVLVLWSTLMEAPFSAAIWRSPRRALTLLTAASSARSAFLTVPSTIIALVMALGPTFACETAPSASWAVSTPPLATPSVTVPSVPPPVRPVPAVTPVIVPPRPRALI